MFGAFQCFVFECSIVEKHRFLSCVSFSLVLFSGDQLWNSSRHLGRSATIRQFGQVDASVAQRAAVWRWQLQLRTKRCHSGFGGPSSVECGRWTGRNATRQTKRFAGSRYRVRIGCADRPTWAHLAAHLFGVTNVTTMSATKFGRLIEFCKILKSITIARPIQSILTNLALFALHRRRLFEKWISIWSNCFSLKCEHSILLNTKHQQIIIIIIIMFPLDWIRVACRQMPRLSYHCLPINYEMVVFCFKF